MTALASTPPGTHPRNILVGATSTGISPPPILLRTFGYSRPILVALRSLSLKPISFGYKTPPIRFSQAGEQSAHKARLIRVYTEAYTLYSQPLARLIYERKAWHFDLTLVTTASSHAQNA